MRFSNTRYTVRQNISLGVAVDCGCFSNLENRKMLLKNSIHNIDNMNLYNF